MLAICSGRRRGGAWHGYDAMSWGAFRLVSGRRVYARRWRAAKEAVKRFAARGERARFSREGPIEDRGPR